MNGKSPYNTILVTGGAGFIGSNLSILFKEKYPDIKIVVLDNLKRRGSELNVSRLKEKNIEFVHGDIRNSEDLDLDMEIDLLIECSAEPSVLAGYGRTLNYLVNTNLMGTVNCLELAKKYRADMIFISTSRVYPYESLNTIEKVEKSTRFEWSEKQVDHFTGWSLDGITEDYALDGARSLYGTTKLCSELLIQEYAVNFGIRTIINRCSVVAGPWQFGKIDQGVIALWMLAHYFKKSLTYIGFDGKGKQVRDLLHVEDLFYLIDLQQCSMDILNGKTFNIGGGNANSFSLIDLTEICQGVTGNKIELFTDPTTRPGDIAIFITDTNKILKEINWKPVHNIEQTIGDVFRWISANEKLLNNTLCNQII